VLIFHADDLTASQTDGSIYYPTDQCHVKTETITVDIDNRNIKAGKIWEQVHSKLLIIQVLY
jgi:hypothetical protein